MPMRSPSQRTALTVRVAVCVLCCQCGELCCRSCTQKVHLPAKLEKKGKELSRVCTACILGVLVRRVVRAHSSHARQLGGRISRGRRRDGGIGTAEHSMYRS